MATFSNLSVWPVGYFRAYSSWLLKNRRDVARRLSVINAEVDRIGFVKLTYAKIETADGQTRRTEVRESLWVTPGSSLGHLMQAYIVAGGNPLDISSFMHPDTSALVSIDPESGEGRISDLYPYGGVVAPMSAAPMGMPDQHNSNTNGYTGGFARTDRYYPARQGGTTSPGAYDHDAIVKTMHQLRGWANQDLKERLQNLEWQIVKLCDLREQLVKERDDILNQAFGGVLTGLPPLDESRFDSALRVQSLVQDMYQLLYDADPHGKSVLHARPDVPFLRFTFADLPSELRDPLGC